MELSENRFARMEDALFEAASPSRTCIIDREQEVSYAQLQNLTQGFAHQLQEAGLEPGDRVAVFLEKSLESVVALFGIWRAGGIAVPIHPTLKALQVDYILKDSGARLLVSNERKLARSGLQRDGLPPLLEVNAQGSPAGSVANSDEARAAILYTSGSTGRPKGILISHQNLLAGARIVSNYLEISESERILSVTPFSFDYGLNQLLSAIYCNAMLVLCRSSFPPEICKLLEEHEITGLAAVPPLWIQLRSRVSPFPGRQFPHLRYMTNTGGVFPEELVRAYRKQLPETNLVLMYGLSEAFRSTYLPPELVDRLTTSMGKAIPDTTLYVVDDEGNEVPPGTEGELVHRGPTVAMGYWENPGATARVFRPDPVQRDGEIVVFSGDRVKRDEQGYFFFSGRADQMIKSQGYRLSPEEIEEYLFESGLLREVVVAGRPDPESGQRIVAHVVGAADYSEEALIQFCRRQLPSHMVPSEIFSHDTLPRTPSGKFDRKRLG